MKTSAVSPRRLLILASLMCCAQLAVAEAPIAIAIHGGAGTINRSDLSDTQEKAIHATLARALRAGHKRLTEGDSALDAVATAIVILEDSEHFNAGRGAVFTSQGVNELDAAIMDGRTRNAGAIAAVRHIQNPILLARRVMSESEHVMLAGDGAEEFALAQGFSLVPAAYFHTERRWRQLQQARDAEKTSTVTVPAAFRYGTVGAVALDSDGNLAAGTSTGGMTNKRFGRIGDVPVIGAGTYADNETCAISATGHGEFFIRAVVGHDIASMMRYQSKSVVEAATEVVSGKLVKFGGSGGVIAMSRSGEIALVHNTSGMYRGSIDTTGALTTAIYSE